MAAATESDDYAAPSVFETGAGSRNSGVRTAGKGLVREMEDVTSGFGKGPVPYDKRKFRYDMYRAQATNVGFAVSRDDRMSAQDAGALLHDIHVKLGIAKEEEALLKAFDDALFFSHTVNSGSVLQPGRSKVFIQNKPFDMLEINRMLGTDMRRFYRAFADDIATVNKRVLAEYDPYDPVKVEHHGWITQVALERGLQRYPYLAHDSADACVNINMAERIALANSKRLVIGSVINSVDRAHGNARVQSVGGYDSTNGAVQEG